MTVPYYGKRDPGALTASSPGDTLFFQFASYNDSGNSEALTGFAVGDIEVFKNGLATARATDSGYSLISDTGQIGDRVGLYRFSIQLFNTADDSTFYASDAWYQVAVDNVAIDGKTVRLWVGSFEIGRQHVDVREINGDTGAANHLKNTFANGFADTGLYDTLADYDTGTKQRLGQIQSDVDTGLRVHIDDSDTGIKDVIADLDTGLRDLITDHKNELDTGIKDWIADLDTGLRDLITDHKNELDTGIKAMLALADTGKIATAVWAGDTGLRDLINDTDTGLRKFLDYMDTGIKERFDTLAEDTGGVSVTSILGDTGATRRLLNFGNALGDQGQIDTGTLAGTKPGTIDANVTNVNEIAVGGAGTSGNPWGPA